jgi:hypothetical protein
MMMMAAQCALALPAIDEDKEYDAGTAIMTGLQRRQQNPVLPAIDELRGEFGPNGTPINTRLQRSGGSRLGLDEFIMSSGRSSSNRSDSSMPTTTISNFSHQFFDEVLVCVFLFLVISLMMMTCFTTMAFP